VAQGAEQTEKWEHRRERSSTEWMHEWAHQAQVSGRQKGQE
jgi:hypothetical protein